MICVFVFNLYHDDTVRKYYQATRCYVVLSRINSKDKAVINLAYIVDDHHYLSSASGTMRINPLNTYKLVESYHAGDLINCWYDTRNPNAVIISNEPNIILYIFYLFIIILCLGFILIQRLLNRDDQPQLFNKDNSNDPIRIINHRYTEEYIRNSDTPITREMLPPNYLKTAKILQDAFIEKLNRTGSVTTIKPNYIWVAVCVLIILCVILFLLMVNL